MNTQKCAGCPNNPRGIALLQCSRCVDKYHYTCLNLTKESYQSLSKELKDKWICPTCRCKEPKLGDNTNTPVRSAPATVVTQILNETLPSPCFDNVTHRSKLRSPANCDCISADTIRDIIREELDRKFNTQINDIQLKLSRLDDRLSFFNTEHDKIKRECEAQKLQLSQLQRDNEQLRTLTADLAQRLNQTEQLTRTCNLEIQCVPENKTENLYKTVQLVASTIKCPLSESDLHFCTRIAKLNPKSPRPRSILVKFSSRRLRDTFLAGVIKFNRNNPTDKLNTSHLGHRGDKKTPVFVCEHLTLETKKLHAEARLKAKELNYRYCWIRDGKLFLRKSDNSNFIVVKDRAILNTLN